MSERRSLAAAVLVLSFAGAALAAEAPVAVSPGYPEELALIEDRCPTFSWGEVQGADAYELVVYRVGERGEAASAVLNRSVPGSALSWTPSLDLCLERGSRYAWTVRAHGDKATSDWSTPSLFQLTAGPSETEFEAALEIVNTYLAARGKETRKEPLEPPASSGTKDSSTPEPPAPLLPPAGTLLSVAGNVDATSFSGSGAGLTSVDADTLDGIDSTAFSTGAHTPDTTCDGADCDLRDPSLASCNTVDTDESGNLVCGTDYGGGGGHPVDQVVRGGLCVGTIRGLVECRTQTLCDALGYRYIDMGDGTIQDCATGLFWLKEANCGYLNTDSGGVPGPVRYEDAETAVGILGDPHCGLTDTSIRGDWRLPTLLEWCSSGQTDPDPNQRWAPFTCPPENAPDSLLDTSLAGGPKVANGSGAGNWSEDDAFNGPLSSVYWAAREERVEDWVANPTTGGLESTYLSTLEDASVWAVREALPAKRD